jgi:hypothetical protein
LKKHSSGANTGKTVKEEEGRRRGATLAKQCSDYNEGVWWVLPCSFNAL